MKRKFKVTYPDKIQIIEVKCELSFGTNEGKKWLKEAHPEAKKIEHIKTK